MAKSKANAPKSAVKSSVTDAAFDLSSAVGSVGKMVVEVSNSLDNLDKLYHLEQVADNLGNLSGLDSISQAIAGYTIAQYGSEEDRAKIVEHFKGWFLESGIFRD